MCRSIGHVSTHIIILRLPQITDLRCSGSRGKIIVFVHPTKVIICGMVLDDVRSGG